MEYIFHQASGRASRVQMWLCMSMTTPEPL